MSNLIDIVAALAVVLILALFPGEGVLTLILAALGMVAVVFVLLLALGRRRPRLERAEPSERRPAMSASLWGGQGALRTLIGLLIGAIIGALVATPVNKFMCAEVSSLWCQGDSGGASGDAQ